VSNGNKDKCLHVKIITRSLESRLQVLLSDEFVDVFLMHYFTQVLEMQKYTSYWKNSVLSDYTTSLQA
jgi:hypothetical protein